MDNIGPWIFASACLLVLGGLIYKWPKRTLLTLIAIIVIVVGGGVAFFMYSSAQSAARVERSKSLIGVSDISIEDWRMRPSIIGTEIVGTVVNNSEHTVSSLIVNALVYDCARGEGCPAIGEQTKTVYLSVPPGQARPLQESMYFFPKPAFAPNAWHWDGKILEVFADVD